MVVSRGCHCHSTEDNELVPPLTHIALYTRADFVSFSRPRNKRHVTVHIQTSVPLTSIGRMEIPSSRPRPVVSVRIDRSDPLPDERFYV